MDLVDLPETLKKFLLPNSAVRAAGSTPVGTGCMGAVMPGELFPPYAPAPFPVVLKTIPFTPLALRNKDIMLSFSRHPNLLRCKGIIPLPEKRCLVIVSERHDGDLFDLVMTSRKPQYPRLVLEYLVQAARGLAHVHSHNVAHGVFKPVNLLLSRDKGLVCLGDFGLLRPSGPEQPPDEGYFGSLAYSAPELLPGPGYAGRSTASDVWALGCTIYALFCRRPPFLEQLKGIEGGSKRRVSTVQFKVGSEVLEKISGMLQEDVRLPLGKHFALEGPVPAAFVGGLEALVSDCLALQPSARPTASSVMDRLCALRRLVTLRNAPIRMATLALRASVPAVVRAGAEAVTLRLKANNSHEARNFARAVSREGAAGAIVVALRKHSGHESVVTAVLDTAGALCAVGVEEVKDACVAQELHVELVGVLKRTTSEAVAADAATAAAVAAALAELAVGEGHKLRARVCIEAGAVQALKAAGEPVCLKAADKIAEALLEKSSSWCCA